MRTLPLTRRPNTGHGRLEPLRKPLLELAAVVLGILLLSTRADGQVTVEWARHHDHRAVGELTQKWKESFPSLVSVESMGESIQGRELWLVTVTNRETGPPEEKPALWIDGHSDGGEVLSKEVALYLIHHLVTNYETDERISHLLDTRVLYVAPNANPDPGEQLLQEPRPGEIQGVSRTGYLYPVDEDGDGAADEDPPEDIDGDGLVLSMRVRDPEGDWKTHPAYPRMLVRRTGSHDEDGPFYRLYETEGVDNDGDGRINEDWLGGFDSNRMFPVNWRPEWAQPGAPPYPLFTPESKAIVDAVRSRPNIGVLISLHTSGVFPGGTLWQAPSSESPDSFPYYDMEFLYPEVGDVYERIMRREAYPYSRATAANIYEREPRDLLTGLLVDWGYLNRGVLSFTPEIWARGIYDYDGDGTVSLSERIRWNEEEWNGRLFVDWKETTHPELGRVEIGGWRNDYDAHGLMPPEGFRYRSEQILPWFVYVVEALPRIVIADAEVEELQPEVFRVTIRVTNAGFFDTSVTERAARLESSRGPLLAPIQVTLEIEDGEVLGANRKEIGQLRGLNASGRYPKTQGRSISSAWPRSRTVTWTVRAEPGAVATVTAIAQRAGTARTSISF